MELACKKARTAKWQQLIRGNAGGVGDCGSQSYTLAAEESGLLVVVRQKYRQDADKRQESADFIDQLDTGMVS